MAFKLYKCKGPDGLPLIEIPTTGQIRERLSPGTIREADLYENFRYTKIGPGRVLLACRRGDTDSKGVCKSGQRVLRIIHDRKALPSLIKECRSGRLSKKRQREINKIMKDVKSQMGGLSFHRAINSGYHPIIAPHMLATTPIGKLFQFMLTSLITVVFFMIWYKTLWPEEKP